MQPTQTMSPPLLSARAHEDAVHTMLAWSGLPALTARGTDDAVHVTVAGDSDLAEWLDAQPGPVTVETLTAGVQVWTLHTRMSFWARGRESSLPLLVHSVLPVGALVDADVLAAVAR